MGIFTWRAIHGTGAVETGRVWSAKCYYRVNMAHTTIYWLAIVHEFVNHSFIIGAFSVLL